MKLRTILTESTFPTFRSEVKPNAVSIYGAIEGEKEVEILSCTVEWKFTYEQKSWGVKNLGIDVIKVAVEYELPDKTVEKVYEYSNCDFNSEIDLNNQIFIGDVEIDTSAGEDNVAITVYNN